MQPRPQQPNAMIPKQSDSQSGQPIAQLTTSSNATPQVQVLEGPVPVHCPPPATADKKKLVEREFKTNSQCKRQASQPPR